MLTADSLHQSRWEMLSSSMGRGVLGRGLGGARRWGSMYRSFDVNMFSCPGKR